MGANLPGLLWSWLLESVRGDRVSCLGMGVKLAHLEAHHVSQHASATGRS